MSYAFDHLHIAVDGRCMTVTIDNPPINLITKRLFVELLKFSAVLEQDPNVTVVVFKSALPEFFIAHFDVEAILEFPVPSPGEAPTPNAFHTLCRRLGEMNKITIAQIEGRIGGGGSELAAAMDMRFGVLGHTVINQMEVPIGILPGGSGTQRLPRLVGRARALEIIVGGDDLDAATAERWGYLNRAFEPGEIDTYVARLSQRIASFPPEAVRLAKEAVHHAELPLEEGLAHEDRLFNALLRTPEAGAAMRAFLGLGGQTPAGEREVGVLNERVAAYVDSH